MTKRAAPRRSRWGTGWIPDPPDPRDLTPEHERVQGAFARRGAGRRDVARRRLPRRVDLRADCPPVRFQGGFNTCSAHVVGTLVDYFEQRAFGKRIDASRLFLYKVTKNFLQVDGDVAVYIRQTMGALRLVGVPPERYWPYPDPGTLAQPNRSDPRLDAEPSPFCYALADDYRSLVYYRLDGGAAARRGDELLTRLRRHLAGGLPVTLGFPLFPSIAAARTDGRVPLPAAGETAIGSHAVAVVGYDDGLAIGGDGGTPPTRGALLFQNSWSTQWGEQGYGWLPYAYVERGDAKDFWTLVRGEWIDSGKFQLP